MATHGTKSTSGIDLVRGDYVCGFGRVLTVRPGRHELGALFADVTFGEKILGAYSVTTHRVWAYHRYPVRKAL